MHPLFGVNEYYLLYPTHAYKSSQSSLSWLGDGYGSAPVTAVQLSFSCLPPGREGKKERFSSPSLSCDAAAHNGLQLTRQPDKPRRALVLVGVKGLRLRVFIILPSENIALGGLPTSNAG